MIDTQPKICNICGGEVIFTSNANVYGGREYGSGKCYLCLNCGAYVGAHKPRPHEALGLLYKSQLKSTHTALLISKAFSAFGAACIRCFNLRFVLADKNMRKGKMMCHDIFDSKWRGKRKSAKKRDDLYAWLAKQLDIPVSECHFGYFDLPTLRKAYKILLQIKDNNLVYDSKGNIINKCA